MAWVTVETASSGETYGINTDLVRCVIDRKTCAVIEFIDGHKMTVRGGLDQWYAAIEDTSTDAIAQEDVPGYIKLPEGIDNKREGVFQSEPYRRSNPEGGEHDSQTRC